MIRQLATTTVLITLIAAIGCKHGVRGEAEPGEHEKKAIVVQAEPVKQISMEHIVRGIGTTTSLPSHQVVIAPAVEGIVAEILVNEGDEIQAGRPLVRLDDRLAQRELAERKAARAELEAALTLLKTPPRKEEQQVADREVERGLVAEELAQKVVDQLTRLNQRSPKDASDQQLFEAQQRLRDARLARQVAEGHRTVLMLGPKPEAVAEA